MEIAEIRYRVVDFLKLHAPFNAMVDTDLLGLVAEGRVRFHEPNEYILWQGEPHKALVFVIQQGTVSLWDESGSGAELRDVRGAGDLLGIERYTGARSCLYSARSESDIVLYGFPAGDFETYVLKYPHAAQYVTAEGHAAGEYQPGSARRDPRSVFLLDLAGRRPLPTCRMTDSIAHAAHRLLASGSEALAVVGADHRARAVLTPSSILTWVAAGGGNAEAPLADLAQQQAAIVLGPEASVTDGVLTMAAADVGALLLTADGTLESPLQTLVTGHDLAAAFGEHPTALLREIRRASTLRELAQFNRRSRAFVLDSLTSAGAVEWLAPLAHLVDTAIVARALALTGGEHAPGCWCFCGSSGRAEALTRRAPDVLVIVEADGDLEPARHAHERVIDALQECDYLPRLDSPQDKAFHVATAEEWSARFHRWVTDPVMQQTYQVRSLFDLRPFRGDPAPWRSLEAAVMGAVDRDVIHVLANDCLASLPPLTFFQDNVIDSVGEQSAVFRLEHSALRPLVDVGRVFGMAGKHVFGTSTQERFATARTLLPEHEAIFREASDTLRVVLWQQGRVGISQGTSGFDLPPALLSRYDRQVLKGGFRSILRLLEFTGARDWIERI